LLPRTHVAACPQLAKADDRPSLSATRARRRDLQIRSSFKERDRQHQERELKEGKEAIAREITERNHKAGWA
jgi:hypothetical protein